MTDTAPQYDVALSFAGEDRPFVSKVARELRSRGVRVFYDEYEQVSLWGKDLYTHLGDVYRKRARYTVLFASKHYAGKLWTGHERQHAQARALAENREYILPARFDDTEVPGLAPTIGYVDLCVTSPAELADLIVAKVKTPHGGGTAQSTLSNSDLRNKVLDLVRKMRTSIEEHELAHALLTFDDEHRLAESEEARSRAWNKRNSEYALASRKLMTEFDNRFKVRAILYRDELIMRLPSMSRDKHKDFTYEHPTNPLGMKDVVDDLELLCRQLPY